MTSSLLLLLIATIVVLFIRRKFVNRGRNHHVFSSAETWRAETELMQNLPRKVDFNFSTDGFFYFILVVEILSIRCYLMVEKQVTRADLFTWLSAISIISLLTGIRWYVLRKFELPLVRYGLATPGLVIRVKTNECHDSFVLKYEVNGQTYKGEQASARIDAYKGEYLTVLYDPDDPDIAVVYALTMYRARK